MGLIVFRAHLAQAGDDNAGDLVCGQKELELKAPIEDVLESPLGDKKVEMDPIRMAEAIRAIGQHDGFLMAG
jgi:hypothetical protein